MTTRAKEWLGKHDYCSKYVANSLRYAVDGTTSIRMLDLSGTNIIIDVTDSPIVLPSKACTAFCVPINFPLSGKPVTQYINIFESIINEQFEYFSALASPLLLLQPLITHELIHAVGVDGTHELAELLTDSVTYLATGAQFEVLQRTHSDGDRLLASCFGYLAASARMNGTVSQAEDYKHHAANAINQAMVQHADILRLTNRRT